MTGELGDRGIPELYPQCIPPTKRRLRRSRGEPLLMPFVPFPDQALGFPSSSTVKIGFQTIQSDEHRPVRHRLRHLGQTLIRSGSSEGTRPPHRVTAIDAMQPEAQSGRSC